MTIARSLWILLALLAPLCAEGAPADYQLFARSNLVAWCIVPFDAKKRGPEERAEMLRELGFKKFAYDYRAEHIPTFDREIAALKKNGVELYAWWFPTSLNEEARMLLATFKKHDVQPQLWVTGGGEPAKSAAEQTERVEAEAKRISEIAREAQKAGCMVALYNHGGWFGQVTNQIAVIERLRRENVSNVRIVYNLHHAHHEMESFPEVLKLMTPHLVCLNLNGMVPDGDRVGKKILPIGEGTDDSKFLKALQQSGWRGPIGILNHTDEDAEKRLRQNLAGLEGLLNRLKP